MRSALNDFLPVPGDGPCELITVLALYAIKLSRQDKRRCLDRVEISQAKMGLRSPHFGDLLIEDCTKEIAIDPSPTAEATLFTLPDRTSPAARISTLN